LRSGARHLALCARCLAARAPHQAEWGPQPAKRLAGVQRAGLDALGPGSFADLGAEPAGNPGEL